MGADGPTSRGLNEIYSNTPASEPAAKQAQRFPRGVDVRDAQLPKSVELICRACRATWTCQPPPERPQWFQSPTKCPSCGSQNIQTLWEAVFDSRPPETEADVMRRERDTERARNTRLEKECAELLQALSGILDIGKRDMSNPKYDGYFDTAKMVIGKIRGL